jgi:electron transfer flavoprotein alpha subunit
VSLSWLRNCVATFESSNGAGIVSILVIAEHDNQRLASGTLNTITAARQLGSNVHVLVAGYDNLSVAQEAATLRGVSKVKIADAAHYAALNSENLTALILANITDVTHILAPATTFGNSLLPRVAALLDVEQISDITVIEGSDTFVRPIYDGLALATIRSTDRINVITVRTTAFDPVATGHRASIEVIPAAPDTGQSRLVSREISTSNRPDLRTADIVISGGRGLASAESFQALLEPLADRLGAAIGASRAAVDAGFTGNDCQVGSTGKVVAPRLYFAIGISGAVQHLAGHMDAQTIVAINKDPDAPIFQVADYGLVADLFDAVPRLIEALGPKPHG